MDFLFRGLVDYDSYINFYEINDLVQPGVLKSSVAALDTPSADFKNASYSPGAMRATPYPPQRDDLVRLHYLVVSRKVTTILEFGSGHSTRVFDHALGFNQRQFGLEFSERLRGSNLFECHTVEDDPHWFGHTKASYEFENVYFSLAATHVSSFNDRICTFYSELPNVCPDLIYLDGPDQFSAKGAVRGISTAHPDRVPMAGDVLAIEHFLLPGTLVVVDGRSANARFLKANFQRNWQYWYSEQHDQHFFELVESPLGEFSRAKIQFQLGTDFFNRAAVPVAVQERPKP